MKHIVFNYDDKKMLKNAENKAKKKSFKTQLIQVFTSLNSSVKIKKLIKTLNKSFPNAIIIGTTTAGEIAHAKMFENSTIISLSLFKKTVLKLAYTKNTDKKSGLKLSSKIFTKQTKAAIVLSEGLTGRDYQGFLEGFKERNPKVIVAGGLAGDNFELKQTLIFDNNNIYTKGSLGVSFSSKSLYVDNQYNLNWTPIGKEFTITKASGVFVQEIDNIPAVDFFATYLGKNIFKNNAKTLPDFQLLFKDGVTTIARTPMAVDGSALAFAAPIKEGQVVQFGFSNAASVISASSKITHNIRKKPAEAIFIYSCIARKLLLGNTLENEFLNFESISNTAGFFTYGEYYSTSKNNALLNCTTTLLVMSESKKIKKENKNNSKFSSTLEDTTFNALIHFIKQTSFELNANTQILNQYKTAVDTSLLVSKTDKNGIITYVNDNFCRVSQYTKKELIGSDHNIIRHQDVSSFIFKKLWSTIKKGKIWHGEFPNKAKDGSTYYVQATVMPTYTDNKPDGYIAIRQDITKQIIAKKKMKEKEKFIKALFDNQENIVILASRSIGILNVNKTLFEYFNFTNLDDFKAKHKCICELFLKEDGYINLEKDPQWLDTILDNPQKDHKVKMLAKDNNIKIFNIKISKFNEELIINLSDITNLENALKKAYSSEQAKTMFLANMSHEIRTPLNGILGFTEILKKQKLEKNTGKYIDIIHKSGQSLLSIVDDILDYSKIESGELNLFISEANLFLEMEAAIFTFASAAKSKNINYITHIDTNIPKIVECDVQRIKQVISNLISNAVKFTPEKGIVNISIALESIKQENAKVKFMVQDSGIGISEEKVDGIFKAFSQADNSISRQFGGTGLGLSISSSYIDMMNSKLQVKSVEGYGSTFYFTLDLKIIDSNKSIEETSCDKKISIIQVDKSGQCDMSSAAIAYLDGWSYNYEIINDIKELDKSTDILIVSSSFIDKPSIENILDNNMELNVICLETGEDFCTFAHKKFHSIEQPMIGSSLFNILHTLLVDSSQVLSCNLEKTKKFQGKVLVAEDNETNQMLISVILDERNLDYTIVENGQLAVNEALKNNYDIIFMDINMPVLDGLSAIKILKENNYTKPIISLSANVIESDIKKYKEAGVAQTLRKPIVTQELDEILKKYLQQSTEILSEFDNMNYDTINLESLSQSLSLVNEAVIIKLLFSFKTFAQETIEKISKDGLNLALLHTIKGTSGNLRFKQIYQLIVTYEENFELYDQDELILNSQKIIKHLQNLIDQIDKL